MVLLTSYCSSSVREISLGCDILRIFYFCPELKTRKAPTKPPTKKTGEMKFTQGLPGKSLGGTPFLNQKKVNLVIPETGGARLSGYVGADEQR